MARSRSTPATAALAEAGVDFSLHAFEHDPRVSSYGLEAADALDVDPGRVLKTLVVDLDGSLVVAVVPVTAEADLKAVASALAGKKAAIADRARAERATGYVVGGVSPLGQRRRHRTVLDSSAFEHETVLVSAGRRGLDLELAPDALRTLSEAVVDAIARFHP